MTNPAKVQPMARDELVRLLASIANAQDESYKFERLVDLYERWLLSDKYRVLGAAILWYAWSEKLLDYYFQDSN